jgi:hypothetical protein
MGLTGERSTDPSVLLSLLLSHEIVYSFPGETRVLANGSLSRAS